MHPSQHKKFTRFSPIVVMGMIALVGGIFVSVLSSQQGQNTTTNAWYTSYSAYAMCPAYGGTANINVSFSNKEANQYRYSMNVVAKDRQTGKSVSLGAIAGGQTKTGVIQTGRSTLAASIVDFYLTWTDGHSGSDSKYTGYAGVSYCAPVAPTPTKYYAPTPTPTPFYAPTPTPTTYYAPTPTPTTYYAPTPTPTVYISPTPTPTVYIPVPTPTVYYAPTPTPTTYVTPTPTPAVYPTNTPMPMPTYAPGSTMLALTLGLHGIGNGGDSANASGQGNTEPLHPQRSVTIELYDTSNALVKTQTGQVMYASESGLFKGTISLNSAITTGFYTAKVKTDQFLKVVVPGIQKIVTGEALDLPKATLITGDINNDNIINILDYNILAGCYSDLSPALSCAAGDELKADITDDGHVNQFDYNLFLRELANRSGQ